MSFHILRVLMMDVKPGGKLSSSPHHGAEELFCNILQHVKNVQKETIDNGGWWMVVMI